MSIRNADAAAIDDAARRLRAGGLVAFPTETVYGLGADAANADAVAAVYRTKGRPAGHPLIVHVLDASQARWWAEFDANADRLAAAFWPGPLTLILRRREGAPAFACGSESTIGLRSPAHPVARALLEDFVALGGRGVAAPSANRFGRVSPTRAAHVIEDLGEDSALIIDGGACEVGVESTIVDLSRGTPVLLRPGGVSARRIEQVLGTVLGERDVAAPRASGTLAAHYAPRTALELIDTVAIEARLRANAASGLRFALWSRERPSLPVAHWEAAEPDAPAYAQRLYDTLRALDSLALDRILVERTDSGGEWAAIADRLARAAATFEDMP